VISSPIKKSETYSVRKSVAIEKGRGLGIQINGGTRVGSAAAPTTIGHGRRKTHGNGGVGNRARSRTCDTASGMVRGGTGRVGCIVTVLGVVIKVNKTTCHRQIVERTHNGGVGIHRKESKHNWLDSRLGSLCDSRHWYDSRCGSWRDSCLFSLALASILASILSAILSTGRLVWRRSRWYGHCSGRAGSRSRGLGILAVAAATVLSSTLESTRRSGGLLVS
jgi:hypothetical protein